MPEIYFFDRLSHVFPVIVKLRKFYYTIFLRILKNRFKRELKFEKSEKSRRKMTHSAYLIGSYENKSQSPWPS